MKRITDETELSKDKKYILKFGKYLILLYSEGNNYLQSQMFSEKTNLSDLFKYSSKITAYQWSKRLRMGLAVFPKILSKTVQGRRWTVSEHYELYEIENFSEIESMIVMQELIG